MGRKKLGDFAAVFPVPSRPLLKSEVETHPLANELNLQLDRGPGVQFGAQQITNLSPKMNFFAIPKCHE